MNKLARTSAPAPEIVVGVDASAAGEAAVRYALAEARRSGARVRLVHVVPLPGPWSPTSGTTGGDALLEQGRALLAGITARARAVAPGTDVRKTLAIGPRAAELARAGAGAGLVVLGRRHHALTTGSTAVAVAAGATGPVRVVPEGWVPGLGGEEVVVGVKSLATAEPLLERGFAVAAERGAGLVVAHCWHLPPGYGDLVTDEEVTEHNARVAAELADAARTSHRHHPGVPVRFEVRHGRPAQALEELAERSALVVVGRHEHRRHPGHLGRVPRALIQAGRAPVELAVEVDHLRPELDLLLEREGELLR